MPAAIDGRKGYAAVRVFDCGGHHPFSSAHARGAAGRDMGRELGRLRARALPRRQPVGAAGSTVRLSLRANRGERPDVSPDRAARHLGAASAAAAEQRIRHEGRHLRRRVRGLANGRTSAGQANQPVTFGGKASVKVAPGSAVWSDGVQLGFVRDPAELAGRKLAISFHVAGQSGPMTWHAKALTTSYVTAPGAGSKGKSEDEAAFPYSTASWFFVDAVEMMAPANSFAIVAFGDSITDGTASTMNGDDRWADVLSRRLHAVHGNRIAVVNAGIGGNQIAGPAEYGPQKPFPGGPSAVQRIERDVLELSGVTAMIWLEGINDFSRNGNAPVEKAQNGMREVVGRIRAQRPQMRVIGATVVSALGASNGAHGFPEQDDKRKALNEFIRTSGLFDGVIDFDKATLDPQTGGLKAEFVPESTTGGPGDKLHPNHAGYLAMGMVIDLEL